MGKRPFQSHTVFLGKRLIEKLHFKAPVRADGNRIGIGKLFAGFDQRLASFGLFGVDCPVNLHGREIFFFGRCVSLPPRNIGGVTGNTLV